MLDEQLDSKKDCKVHCPPERIQIKILKYKVFVTQSTISNSFGEILWIEFLQAAPGSYINEII
jgi:hypothetical protein